MARAQSAEFRSWRVATTDPVAGVRHLESHWPTVAWLAALVALFLLTAAAQGTAVFRFLVGEDLLFEWLQAGCLAGAGVLAVQGARRAGRARRRLVLAGVAVAAFVVVGEELAWGTRLLNLSVEQVQAVNRQHDATIHNLGFGLKASFLGMAAVSTVLAAWQAVRRNFDLACWFAVPAVYGGLRPLSGSLTYEAAKMSEVAELAFAVAALRLVWDLTRPERELTACVARTQ